MWFKRPRRGPVTQLTLTRDEALVLFEWVEERSDENFNRVHLDHPAEGLALLRLAGALERSLSEPFSAKYPELLAAARERLGRPAG
jgi:hypothetical protein